VLKRTAIIELAQDRISVVVPSATAPSSSCALAHPREVAAAWNAGLTPLDETLHGLITGSGVRGGTARIVYSSPASRAALVSLPAGQSHAEQVARRTMAEMSGQAVPEVIAPIAPLVVDRPSDHRRCHWLGGVDQTEHLEMLAAWAKRAGVRAKALIPLECVTIARAVSEAIHLDAARPAGPAIALRLGRNITAIAGVHNGRLLFAQSLDVSIATMIDALATSDGLERSHGGMAPPERAHAISRAAAGTLIYELGVGGLPKRSASIPGGMTASDLQSLLRPIVQRLGDLAAIAIQDGLERSGVVPGTPRLQISGSGVAVGGLVQALGAQLTMPVLAHHGHQRFRNDDPISAGSLLESVRLRDLPRVNLLSGEAAQRIAQRRLRAITAAGIAFAGTLAALAMTATALRGGGTTPGAPGQSPAAITQGMTRSERTENAKEQTIAVVTPGATGWVAADHLAAAVRAVLPPEFGVVDLRARASHSARTAVVDLVIRPRTQSPMPADDDAAARAAPGLAEQRIGRELLASLDREAIGGTPAIRHARRLSDGSWRVLMAIELDPMWERAVMAGADVE
jgi:hypothetical protein